MAVRRNGIHASQVDAWESRTAANVPANELPQLYAKAIQAIEFRSLMTLSHITVLVVIDRSIHEVKETYPFLEDLKPNLAGIDFSTLFGKTEVAPAELKNGLRELLIEILNVLSNITANVLTAPLHRELAKVTAERALIIPKSQVLRVMNSEKKNREQK